MLATTFAVVDSLALSSKLVGSRPIFDSVFVPIVSAWPWSVLIPIAVSSLLSNGYSSASFAVFVIKFTSTNLILAGSRDII